MVIEVSTEYDPEFKARGQCVFYHDGEEVHAFRSFGEAMAWAFPAHECFDPRQSCESQTDNWAD